MYLNLELINDWVGSQYDIGNVDGINRYVAE